MAILMCKQISSNSFENKITFTLLTHKSYIYDYLTMCIQRTVKLNCLCYREILEID